MEKGLLLYFRFATAPFLFALQSARHSLARPAFLVQLRTRDSSLIQPTEENEKSEPFSYWKKVRIFLVWCG